MFASKSLAEHLFRGLAGLLAIATAVVMARTPGIAATSGSVALALLGLFLLRGCPVCWTVGLGQIIWRTANAGKSVPAGSDDVA